MATAVVMPKQGQSVESCLIVEWKKAKGDTVAEGDPLCDVETDKAVLEVPSPVSGTLLDVFFDVGDEVPVLTTIAAIGEPGEAVDDLRPEGTQAQPADRPSPPPARAEGIPAAQAAPATESAPGVSPRAKRLAQDAGVDLAMLVGTGPGGRIIERDVQAALTSRQPPAAPAVEAAPAVSVDVPPFDSDEATVIPLNRVRKLIAARMLESLQTTAQLTLNTAADASQLLEVRTRLRPMSERRDLPKITINDLLLFTVSRVLLDFPELNAHFGSDAITQFGSVHLGFAVDTPRGLMVPVIRHAHNLSLRKLAQETKRLAGACTEGRIHPDELTGGTFTVSNLGHLDIESFTPVLNPPQVGILGVGKVSLRPVETDGEVDHLPHLNLSLTVNHQVVDGAPAARFLQALAQGLTEIELLLMM